MIPPILHYGMFGDWKMKPLNLRCQRSWEEKLPTWEQRLCNDANGPKESPFFREALQVRPINAHNYFLLWSVWKYGGVAVDNDVEVVRPFDQSQSLFVGRQFSGTELNCVNNAVLGAEERHPLLRSCLDQLDKLPGDWEPVNAGPGILTTQLFRLGLTGEDKDQQLSNALVYSRDRFYPFSHDERHDWMKVTDRTFAVHHWQGSWQ